MRPYAALHQRCETALAYPSGAASEVIGGTIPGGPVPIMAAAFHAVGSTGAVHLTLSTTATTRLLPEKWYRIAMTYIKEAGHDPLKFPWVAFRQPAHGHDHIHLVAATLSFAGRPINLLLSQSETDAVQQRLAAEFEMNEPRLFNPKHGVATQIRSTTRKGRLPEMRGLITAINRAFSSWPETFERFAHLLRLQPGGFAAERKINGHGRTSFLFKGPGIRPMYGGALSAELQPRFMEARFALGRSLQRLRNMIAEEILATAPLSRFSPDPHKGKPTHANATNGPDPSTAGTFAQDDRRPEVPRFRFEKHERHRASSEEPDGVGGGRGAARAGGRNPAGIGSSIDRPDRKLGTSAEQNGIDDAERDTIPDIAVRTDGATVGGPSFTPLHQRMIRIAAVTRRIFKNTRLEVLPEAEIAVFVGERRVVVFDNRDNVAVLDVPHPKVVELSVLVKPTTKIDPPIIASEPDAVEEAQVQAFEAAPEEDQDGPGW